MAAVGWDRDRRVGRTAAEVILAVDSHSEVGSVAIEADFDACLEGVIPPRVCNVLLALKQVAVGLLHRSGGRVECLEQSVIELDAGVGVIGGWKPGCGT